MRTYECFQHPAQKTAARWSVNDVSPKGKLLSEHGKAAAPFYAFEMLKLYRKRGVVFPIFGKKSIPSTNPKLDS
jgi:hypothetical protein